MMINDSLMKSVWQAGKRDEEEEEAQISSTQGKQKSGRSSSSFPPSFCHCQSGMAGKKREKRIAMMTVEEHDETNRSHALPMAAAEGSRAKEIRA